MDARRLQKRYDELRREVENLSRAIRPAVVMRMITGRVPQVGVLADLCLRCGP